MEITNKKDLPVISTTKRNDFVEIKFTGYVNGNVFDSNIEEDLKKIDTNGKPRETIIIVGEGMLVPGFDRAIEGKEMGKEYEVNVSAKEGFGDRKRELVKTIPLKIFTEKKINPYPGMVLAMDENLARVITVSGARVLTDFNNPLAGKDLVYKFKIVRKVIDEKEKAKALLEFMFKFVPEFEVGESIVIKGPKFIEAYVTAFNPKFKELMGKELKLEEVKNEKKPEEKKEVEIEKSEEKKE
jgi:FKBP-type peptidyl-prolyl cis-trans isomerase 2